MAQGFKTLIFLTIPLSIFVVILVATSFNTKFWVVGKAANGSDSIDFNYGLFSGVKTKTIIGITVTTVIEIVCQPDEGVCMFSCGQDSERRDDDLANLLSESPCTNSISSDNFFCKDASKCENGNYTTDSKDPRDSLLRYGSFVSVIFFMCLGLLFTLVNFVFSILNSFSNPIQTIIGVHGLVLWNAGAVTCYFLILTIWGGEFEFGIKSVAPLSEVLRPPVYDWNLLDESSLGYSFWLIFLCFIMHAFNLGLVIYYIRKRFKPKRAKKVEPKAGATGTEMLF